MIERGYRDARPFGQRRAQDRFETQGPIGGPQGGDGSGIADWDDPPKPVGLLAWAVRTATVAGLVAVFATQYLARVGAPGDGAVTQIAQGGRALPADPETTGSIGRTTTAASGRSAPVTPAGAAQATRLDPCAVAVAGRPRP